MATTTAIPKTRISGGSFLLEERRPDEIFTPEDFTEQQQLIGQTGKSSPSTKFCPTLKRWSTKISPSHATS
jgi:hypothetical protein